MTESRQRRLAIARQDALAGAFDKTRESPFSYRCRACSRCCHGKAIQLNPYEIARLAEHLGISTTEFIDRFTVENGAFLAMVESDHACVFLGNDGCTVHPARPLVCRVYPLGRHVAPNGEERFADLVPHPETEGEYGNAGSVADYLASQDTARHIEAADGYWELLRRMVVALAESEDGASAMDEAGDAQEEAIDMDKTVRAYCESRGLPFPTDVEAKTKLHLEALEALFA